MVFLQPCSTYDADPVCFFYQAFATFPGNYFCKIRSIHILSSLNKLLNGCPFLPVSCEYVPFLLD
jgi:hypothetical protein